MSQNDQYDLVSFAIIIVIWAFMIAGWVMNIMSLWNTMDGPLTAKIVVRIAGIFVFPLGAILGYL
jgi:hypothetical protein